MTAGTSQKSTITALKKTADHNHNLLLALSRAARSIQQSCRAEEIYSAVGREIKSLGGEATILIMDEDGKSLSMVYTSHALKIIHQAEKLTGLSARGYWFPISAKGTYAKALSGGKAVFVVSMAKAITEALPKAIRLLAETLTQVLKLRRGILVPLCAGNDNLGLLALTGTSLEKDDAPAMESLAGQIAAGLQNVRLAQKLRGELTARQQAEKQLKIATSTCEGIFNRITEAVYILDKNGVFLKVNSGAGKMYGYPPDYFVGRTPEFVSAPGRNDLAKVQEHILQAHRGQAVEFEFWGRRKDGSTFLKDLRLTTGMYLGKRVVIAVGRDITKRKQGEASLVESEKQYRLLAERVADVVWVLDIQTMKFKYVSPSVEKLLGYTPEEMVGRSIDQVVPPASLDYINSTFPERIRRFLEGDPSAVTELATVGQWRKDGSCVITEILSTLALNERGQLEMIGVSRDITQRKQVENELRRANESLEAAHRELQKMFEHEQTLARTDGLTRLCNRRHFFELAGREFQASLRYQRPLTIILFDVDGFKQANDTFGHITGDSILTQIARTAASHIRSVDVLARYGGDEFIILLSQTHAQEAFHIAERIRNNVAVMPVAGENSPFIITVSLGVAEIIHSPQDESVEDVIRRADKALYKVKQNGSNHTLIFTGNLTTTGI